MIYLEDLLISLYYFVEIKYDKTAIVGTGRGYTNAKNVVSSKKKKKLALLLEKAKDKNILSCYDFSNLR